jgi:hypothetical protein
MFDSRPLDYSKPILVFNGEQLDGTPKTIPQKDFHLIIEAACHECARLGIPQQNAIICNFLIVLPEKHLPGFKMPFGEVMADIAGPPTIPLAILP